MEERRRSQHQHGSVDEPRPIHCDEDVDRFEAQVAMTKSGNAFRCATHASIDEGLRARLHQRRMKVDDVGHDRGAQHGHCQIDGAALEVRHQRFVHGKVPIWVYQEDLHAVTQADHRNEGDDDTFEVPKAALVQC